MKPWRTAREFARLVTKHDDFLDLVEGISHDQQIGRAYARVEKSVWRTQQLERQDDDQLGKAVLASVSTKRREKLTTAFEAYRNAQTNHLLVREQTAYLIGLAIGRRTRR